VVRICAPARRYARIMNLEKIKMSSAYIRWEMVLVPFTLYVSI